MIAKSYVALRWLTRLSSPMARFTCPRRSLPFRSNRPCRLFKPVFHEPEALADLLQLFALVHSLRLGTHCFRGSASTFQSGGACKAVGSQAEPGNQLLESDCHWALAELLQRFRSSRTRQRLASAQWHSLCECLLAESAQAKWHSLYCIAHASRPIQPIDVHLLHSVSKA